MDVLSYEIEHVNIDALKELDSKGKLIIPSVSVLEVIQDKGLQKQFYTKNDVPTLDYSIVTKENIQNAVEEWPDNNFVLKHRKGGYDGKGVQLLNKKSLQK